MLSPIQVQVGIQSWITAHAGLFAEVFLGVVDDQIQHLQVRLDPTHARIASDFLVPQVVVNESCVAEEFFAKEAQVRRVLADGLELLVERVVGVEIDSAPVGAVSKQVQVRYRRQVAALLARDR